jgi:hypothetical protein
MKIKDIHPNTIYRYAGNTKRDAFWFRTGDTVTAVQSPRSESDKAPNNHLLVQTSEGWDITVGTRWIDHVEVLRWIDNARGSVVHHGDQTLDLTFQPQPFQQHSQHLLTYSNPFSDERWLDGERDALIAEWGTEYYWDTTGRPSLVSLGDHVGTVPLSGVEGPFDETEKAAEQLVHRAEVAERNAHSAEKSAAREVLRTEAKSFLVTTLANVPDALVENTSNGLGNTVERAQKFGVSDWSLDYEGGYSGEVDTETPDGDSLVGLKASTLAAITYAWQQVYGDASWEDIAAGVYERHHASEEVKHITVNVPSVDDVEATAERVAAYLPANYVVVGHETYRTRSVVFVKGTDRAGWTADGYVLPRLASGLLTATVDSLSRKAVTA